MCIVCTCISGHVPAYAAKVHDSELEICNLYLHHGSIVIVMLCLVFSLNLESENAT